MSKSKNVIDPESMIKEYGADGSYNYTSDSPPEKDVNGLIAVLMYINFYKEFII